jgi:HemY protein
MRAAWFLVQVGLLGWLVALALAQTGQFAITVGDYHLQGQSTALLIGALMALVVLLAVHRVWLWIVRFPKTWTRYRREIGLIKGHHALTRALQALAAGDPHLAGTQARQAQILMPDFQTVPTILLATTAEAQGNHTAAQNALQALMQTEARDLGVRGLVMSAIKDNEWPRALRLAREAAAASPRHGGVQRLAYDLECQCGEWQPALNRQRGLIKRQALSVEQATFDRVRLETALALEAQRGGDHRAALVHARAAHKADPSFVPAASLLIDLYRGIGATRRALRVLYASFPLNPHPDLIERHEQMAPQIKDVAKRLRYHEKFLSLAPSSAEAQLLLARLCEAEGLWAQSLHHLQTAEKLEPRQGVYRALAHHADAQGDQRGVQRYLELGMNARPDPTWVCPKSGKTFDAWQALVMPDHYFGTITWAEPAGPSVIEPMPASLLPGRLQGVFK